MSRWGRSWRDEPKKPPPEHGIRMKKAGATWWGLRWIEALQSVLQGDAARLARGRTYARAGRTHDLVIKGGTVKAKVTGSRATPYKISLTLAQLDDTAWAKAIAQMAKEARFSAELLAGEMPREIDEAFREAGVSLFPRRRADLTTSCSCPDWGDPCKHVAATHYVLGEALDRDPFLLFELRGKTKEQVLEALRVARGATGGEAAPEKKGRPSKPKPEAKRPPSMKLGKVTPAAYDASRGALPKLCLRFDEPVAQARSYASSERRRLGKARPAPSISSRRSCEALRRRRGLSRWPKRAERVTMKRHRRSPRKRRSVRAEAKGSPQPFSAPTPLGIGFCSLSRYRKIVRGSTPRSRAVCVRLPLLRSSTSSTYLR